MLAQLATKAPKHRFATLQMILNMLHFYTFRKRETPDLLFVNSCVTMLIYKFAEKYDFPA